VDWVGAVPPGEYQVCNSIWLLDDFTEENGATRVVPGSHRWEKTPKEAAETPSPWSQGEGWDGGRGPHPDEVLLMAPAGTVVVFNSHTWHGGTLNRSPNRRRALHSYFCRRGQPQQLDQRRYIRRDTYDRLSPAARRILDVEGCL
jgi:ectoine hydroxylase-related dioxygenase (phytanoyl-CoA dioxygenase family)